MKNYYTLVFILLSHIADINTLYPRVSENNKTYIEERAGKKFNFNPITKLKAFSESQEFKSNINKFVATAGGVSTVGTIKYDQRTPEEIVKEIGDAIIPMIEFGLALVKGRHYGMIGGLIAGAWGLISPVFGKTPMEKTIDRINNEIISIKVMIRDMSDKVSQDVRKKTAKQLGYVISKAASQEIQRNIYICSKYATTSVQFRDDIIKNRTLNETLRFEMIVYLNDCDNFLRDTSGVYVFKKYADVLWVPAVLTTLRRMLFLAEVINFGVYLHLDEEMLQTLWEEKKLAVKQLFDFHGEAVTTRLDSLLGANVRDHKAVLKFTDDEFNGCKIQQQILYLDREIYTYGVPKSIKIQKDTAEIVIATYTVNRDEIPTHIQVYYNRKGPYTKDYDTVLNCICGQSLIVRLPVKRMSFHVVYVPNREYRIRVLYFMKKVLYSSEEGVGDKMKKETKEEENVDRKVDASINDNTIKITIARGSPNTGMRFLINTGFHALNCKLYHDSFAGRQNVAKDNDKCGSSQRGYKGIYVIEDVLRLLVTPDMEQKGKISVEQTDEHGSTLIFGVELIVLPMPFSSLAED